MAKKSATPAADGADGAPAPEFTVLSPVKLGGKRREIGESVGIDDSALADALVAAGLVAATAEAPAEATDPPAS